MPIYGYRCNDCGFQKDHLQKLSDAPIAACPSCQSVSYNKQLSAAGFQLKGSGWYATDFKNSGSKPTSAPKTESTSGEASSTSTSSTPASSEATTTPAAASCSPGCACH